MARFSKFHGKALSQGLLPLIVIFGAKSFSQQKCPGPINPHQRQPGQNGQTCVVGPSEYLEAITTISDHFDEEKLPKNIGNKELFNQIYQTAMSPRCLNCHSGLDYVTVGDCQRRHPMGITRQFSNLGGGCITCHAINGDNDRMAPPRRESWGMPTKAKKMSLSMSPADLCQMWTDPEKNFIENVPGRDPTSPRSLDDIYQHLRAESLVSWAFDPGPGRSVPVVDHACFARDVKLWALRATKYSVPRGICHEL